MLKPTAIALFPADVPLHSFGGSAIALFRQISGSSKLSGTGFESSILGEEWEPALLLLGPDI
jgi:hypothetical protein